MWLYTTLRIPSDVYKRFDLIAGAMGMMPRTLLREAMYEAVKERWDLREIAQDPRVRALLTSGNDGIVVQLHAHGIPEIMDKYNELVRESGYTKSFASQLIMAWYIVKHAEVEIPSEEEIVEEEAS